ncbi:MAG: DNA repair protein RecN [Oscillospiraceae bacterium]
MLRELNIENVAVIERATVEFSSGLNVLTGETGAGKSILIDSINAILGNRTTREIVRSGAERSIIWATFTDVDPDFSSSVSNQGYECDGELILHREITADGKSQCRINGKPATAATVRDVCSGLINIHGQHDNQDLLNPDKHIDIIDAFAELLGEVADYDKIFGELLAAKRELDSVNMDDDQKARRTDLLKYQIDEIEKAQLEIGEDDELISRRSLIRNSEKILAAVEYARDALSGASQEDGALSAIYDASLKLAEVEGVDNDVDSYAVRLSESYYILSDAASDLGSWLDSFDYDPDQLEDIEERLDLIYKLKSKYGSSIEEILQFLSNAQTELSEISSSEERLAALRARCDKLLKDVGERAEQLETKRRTAFPVFERKIKDELEFLNMPGVSFEVDCKSGKLNHHGRNTVEFLVSANAGEPAKPLSRIASGGELSRIMLAVKNALAEKDSIGTLIFDEIDTGVSGTSAGRIGQKLKESSKSRQTICVTHSAQIASYSDSHLLIQKSVRDGRTFTDILPLDREGRIHELARIISGDNVTPVALENASEMLLLAQGLTNEKQ